MRQPELVTAGYWMGLDPATAFVMESYVDLSYGFWRIPVTASAGAIMGAVVLAIAGWRRSCCSGGWHLGDQ
ncbi:hypothetical protein ACIA8G_27760 [Lentzea sp. NPDC051213]|uniref:hypothetical protein n=1 Tax=Lentzea sp. NPDC051213 TaxID=3364126 RepID=UPI0037BA3A13